MTDPHRVDARTLVELLVDEGTWIRWDAPAVWEPDDLDYQAALVRARDRTGVDESVITGAGRVRGVPVALVISEFGFLGGSIGRTAGHRVVAAIERATRDELPVVALPASGGTRMQEGTSAFLQMVAITGAVNAHKAAGLPYIVYLRHPTTGGVFASWGSLGHVTWAQPGALIGFLGPRVFEGLTGHAFPEDVQTSANLHRHGLIDILVTPDELADALGPVLRLLSRGGADTPSSTTPATVEPAPEVWPSVLATRDPRRLGMADLLAPDSSALLRADAPIWLALRRFGGRVAVVIGQDRRRQAGGDLIGPADLRAVRRAMELATDLRLPVVTVIDTPGAELSPAAEEGGLAGEIARCTSELIALPVPTVSVLLGQGAGGAAMALFPTDFRIGAVDSWLSPLPPEGASVIVYRDTEHAAHMADAQGIAASALNADGTLDHLVDISADHGLDVLEAVIADELRSRSRPSVRRRTRTPGGGR
ncbi:carboxyl transferase domain-containing protein [Gordonia sp. LSe1-13]|uniref:Carboxyl transferase domain-containing protein n=1 Tax=Gordonia sesuvii TaxID=3116777 RepID=A0ABU7M8Q7_9ACTN|nr:carboxyl transferase domain-containing protein [Gordonia sp. LSe1-13]